MKTKFTFAALFLILLISTSSTHPSQEIEFQIQIEKQKTAVSDIITISTVLADFITDPNEFPYQAGSYDKNSKIYKALCPYYIRELLVKDPWGNNYLIYCGKASTGQYGISECIEDDFVVVCLGMDGKKEAWELDLNKPEAGIFKVKVLDDFNKDLISWSGSWIRAPEELLEEISE